jgi:hypothetical protein
MKIEDNAPSAVEDEINRNLSYLEGSPFGYAGDEPGTDLTARDRQIEWGRPMSRPARKPRKKSTGKSTRKSKTSKAKTKSAKAKIKTRKPRARKTRKATTRVRKSTGRSKRRAKSKTRKTRKAKAKKERPGRPQATWTAPWWHPKSNDKPPLVLVKEATAAMPRSGRFGESKVYISSIWDRVGKKIDHQIKNLNEFKNWLVEQNRLGNLRLARGDLPSAMDQRLMDESEIRDLGSTFHFVIDDSLNRAIPLRDLVGG